MPPDHSTTDDPTELFDLIDERDVVIGAVLRGAAHANPALMHRSVQILVFATDGHLLLQRRSAHKDLFPNYYCASASGHVASGEDYVATAEREVREELGVELPLLYAGKQIVHSPTETEWTALFLARSDGPFVFHPTETDGGDYFPLADLRPGGPSSTLPMTPALLAALDMLSDPLAADALRALFPDPPAPPRRVGSAETL